MDRYEVPRIGNRSDALELLEQLIDTVQSDDGKAGEFIRQSLEAIGDAAKRGVKSGIMVRNRAMIFSLSPSAVLTKMAGPGSRRVNFLFRGKLFTGHPV